MNIRYPIYEGVYRILTYLIVATDFTVDFSGGTRRGRRVPFAFLPFLITIIH